MTPTINNTVYFVSTFFVFVIYMSVYTGDGDRDNNNDEACLTGKCVAIHDTLRGAVYVINEIIATDDNLFRSIISEDVVYGLIFTKVQTLINLHLIIVVYKWKMI